MNNNTRVVSTVLVVAALLFIGYVAWEKKDADIVKNLSVTGTVCTMEAKLCPDGISYVGRSGPNCEFEACPSGTTATTTPTTPETMFTIGLNKTGSGLDVKITPLSIVEDSRCPSNVQCIQAGTVKVKALLVSGMGTSTEIFELGKPITTESETITLIEVTPVKISTSSIILSQYQFTFRVSKR